MKKLQYNTSSSDVFWAFVIFLICVLIALSDAKLTVEDQQQNVAANPVQTINS